MRRKFITLVVFILAAHLSLSATTLSGVVKVPGQSARFTGTLRLTPSRAFTSGGTLFVPEPAKFVVNNGTITWPTNPSVPGNDTASPSGTYYTAQFYDSYSRLLYQGNYIITGATYDFGAAVPTQIITTNLNYMDLLGLRSISATTADFTTIKISGVQLASTHLTDTAQLLRLSSSIALSQLATTGTPDSTKFLRGDGQWIAPSLGSVPKMFTFIQGNKTGSALVDTDDEDQVFCNDYASSVTFTKVVCRDDAGSPTVNLYNVSAAANMLSSDVTCSNAGTTGTLSASVTIPTGQCINFVLVTAGGTAKRITVSGVYQ